MNRRSSDRIPSKLYAKLSCGDELGTAVVKNLSKEGMFIESKLTFLPDSKFQLVVLLKKEKLNIYAKIRRIVVKGSTIEGIGVELENPPDEYLKIINSIPPNKSFLQ